jgi:glucosamine--fructose-6-phosphate aminotransferase (isomerizing)
MKQFLYLDIDIVNSIIAQSNNGLLQTLSNEQEVISRNGNVYSISTLNNSSLKIESKMFFNTFSIITCFQLIAYYTALYKKLDIDKPRNLAKSVTVE